MNASENFVPCVPHLPYLSPDLPWGGNGLGTVTLPRGGHLHRSEREKPLTFNEVVFLKFFIHNMVVLMK